jgi:hypothetical protein
MPIHDSQGILNWQVFSNQRRDGDVKLFTVIGYFAGKGMIMSTIYFSKILKEVSKLLIFYKVNA